MSDIQVTAGEGGVINVSTGTVVGPLPQLQIAAGTGITIQSGGGVSTISANLSDLSIPANLSDLADVQSGATSGQVLSYNGTAWNGLTLSIPANLADLANVEGTPATGQVLAWNGITWAPADDQTGGSSDVANLSDLADVADAAATTGQALTWDGSQWAGADVPAGTTINGLSGNLSVSGDSGAVITTNGTNIAVSLEFNIANYATKDYADQVAAFGGTGSSTPNVRDLTLVQTYEGRQHFLWSANDLYDQGYTLDVVEVGVPQDIRTAATSQFASDGSLNLTIAMDTESVGYARVFAAADPSNPVWEEAFYSDAAAENGSLELTGIYLPENFTTPGAYAVYASVGDVGGIPIGTTNPQNYTFSQHGSPLPPEILDASTSGENISVTVASDQTPHQLGFFARQDITYYAEINQNAAAATGWVRGVGLQSPSNVETLTVTAPGDGDWSVRVFAENPLGEGPPSDPI